MKKIFFLFALFVLILPFLAFAEDNSQQNMDKFHISGIILDNHKEPVKEAEIKLLVNGKPYKRLKEYGKLDKVISSSHGTFQLEFQLPKGLIETGKIQLEISKTSFKKKTVVEIKKEDFAVKGNEFYANKNIILERYIGPAFWIATIVFIITYALISFELLHRTVAAMLGAVTMLILTYTLGTINPDFHIISFERAIEAIDMNVIFLLMGMMIIIGVLKHTGVFQWCAYMFYKLARGNVMALSIS
ncbi:SLC13 family permease [Thermodesulfobacterium thermophilum]|uniref:SLC13 family permease n=1 Tax=Thermodesulfobacterium thermophilum TaxID=886 RepID=UPI0003F4FD84|nr:SLC13 family permease [Thermodesulfobacterium thermophilum]